MNDNIIQFPNKAPLPPEPYTGACSDCREVIVRLKDLEALLEKAARYDVIREANLYDRLFIWKTLIGEK